MAQPSTTPLPHTSSSTAGADSSDENEKGTPRASTDGSVADLGSHNDREIGDDIERAILLEPEKMEESSPGLDKNTRSAAIWMVANTAATIGIVRLPRILFCLRQSTNTPIGLHEQGNLLGPFAEARTTHIRCLPLLHNVVDFIHSVSICHV